MITTFYVTHKGANYITRAMTDRALVFTRGEFGNGLPPGSPLTMTALTSPLGPLQISKKSAEGNSLIITTQFSNKVNGQILPGFKLTEVGLYGKLQTYDGQDDPENPETLLFYGWTTEDKADYIDTVLTEFLLNFPLTTSGTEKIEVLIDSSMVYPTWEEFDEKLSQIITSFIVENVPVTTDMFSADTTYERYPYKAVIPIQGVTESFVADVHFAPNEADSGVYATVTRTEADTVTIYARSIPLEGFTIPTIECRAAGVLNEDGPAAPGGSGGISDENVATDEEAGDVIDDVFGEGSSEDAGGDSGSDTGDDNVATDEEVKDVIDDVFGPESDESGESGGTSGAEENPDSGDSGGTEGDSGTTDEPTDGDVATDEEVQDVIDNIFG